MTAGDCSPTVVPPKMLIPCSLVKTELPFGLQPCPPWLENKVPISEDYRESPWLQSNSKAVSVGEIVAKSIEVLRLSVFQGEVFKNNLSYTVTQFFLRGCIYKKSPWKWAFESGEYKK